MIIKDMFGKSYYICTDEVVFVSAIEDVNMWIVYFSFANSKVELAVKVANETQVQDILGKLV
jgi:hypothetical protein